MSLDAALSKITKQHGAGSIFLLDSNEALDVPVISTGVFTIDKALGVWGFPRGRVVEVFGPESSGKTTLTLQVIAEAQKAGGKAAFVDAEHALDPVYARKLGVVTKDLLVSQPDNGEQALEITEALVRSGELDVIVVDSVAALVPRAELEGEMGDSVSSDTPVYIRRNGVLDIVAIEDLYRGSKKFYGKRYCNWYRKTGGHGGLEILTASGWKKLLGVAYKKNRFKKPIVGTRTNYGFSKSTTDHSLFSKGEEVSPKELNVGDLLDVVIPDCIIDRDSVIPDVAWLLGYFCADGSLVGKHLTIGSIDRELVEKALIIFERNLCGYTSIRTDSREEPRQPFHVLSVRYRKDIWNLFEQCYTLKSRLKKIPDIILNANPNLQREFLSGFHAGDGSDKPSGFFLHNSSFVLMAGLRLLMDRTGYDGFLSTNTHRSCLMFQIGTNSTGKNRYKQNEVREKIELDIPDYLYDLETSDGTFVGGIGYILHHNSHMGLQARLMSQALRKLTAVVHKSNTCLIFINQLRDKIGVMFGCFNYNARVTDVHGKGEKIGYIVNNNRLKTVLSFNPETKLVEEKPIKSVFKNGKTDEFIYVETTSGHNKKGRNSFAATANHMIFTDQGEKPVSELKTGDRVVALGRGQITKDIEGFLLGFLLGDGNLRPTGEHNAALRIGHGSKQDDYCIWKQSLFNVGWSGRNSVGGLSFDSEPSSDLLSYYNLFYSSGRKAVVSEILQKLTPASVAVWYTDDGTLDPPKKNGSGKPSICAKGFTDDERNLLANRLVELGFPKPNITGGSLRWYGENSRIFQEIISRYVHPSMDYKLIPEFRGRFGFGNLTKSSFFWIPIYARIIKVCKKKNADSLQRFDLNVEDNHTYFVDGVAVHNSPETTTGGRALKFYSSIRVDIRRIAAIKDGDRVIGARTKIKIVKNKVATPFKETETDVMYGQGISQSRDLLDAAVERGIVEKAGSWYSYKDERIGQGKDTTSLYLQENPVIMEEIRSSLIELENESV